MLFGPQQQFTAATPSTGEYSTTTDGVNVWLAWCDSSGNVKVVKSTNQGYDINTPSPVTVESNAANTACLLNESFTYDKVTGRLHLLWDRNEGNASNPPTLRYSHSDDGAATWSTPVAVDNGSTHANNRFFRVGIAAYNSVVGIIYACIDSSVFLTDGLLFLQSTDGGNTWSSPTTLYTVTSQAGEPNAIIGDDGSMHISWYDPGVAVNTGGDAYYARGAWGASGFVWPTNFTRITNGEKWGRVRVATSRGVVMLCANGNFPALNTGQDLRVVRSADNGNTWGNVVLLKSPSGGQFSHPWLNLDSFNGVIICTDTSTTPTNFFSMLSSDAGATWSNGPVPLTTDVNQSLAGQLVSTNDVVLAFGLMNNLNPTIAAIPIFSPNPTLTTSGTVIDNFNRANENPLSNGGTWTLQTGTSAGLQVVSNIAEKSTAPGSFGRNGSQRNDRTFTKGEIFLTVASGSGITYGTDGRIELIFWNESTNDQYILAIQENGVILNKFVTGSFSGSLATVSSVTASIFDKYVLRTTPNDVTVYRFVSGSDWQELIRERDTSFRTNLSAVIEMTSTTDNPAVDDFGGSALLAPSNLTTPFASGLVGINNTLKITDGTWTSISGSTPTRYTYQWQSSPSGANTWSNISLSALKFSTVSDTSKDYRCAVTASNSFGTAAVVSNTLASNVPNTISIGAGSNTMVIVFTNSSHSLIIH